MDTFHVERVREMEKDPESPCICTTTKMSDTLLEFCLHSKIELIPVVMRNERVRYWFPVSHWVRKAQSLSFATAQAYPFPLVCVYRFWAKTKPPTLPLQFGAVIVCNQSNKDALWKIIQDYIKTLSCPALGDAELRFL